MIFSRSIQRYCAIVQACMANAAKKEHSAVFLTLTLPSRFHPTRVQSGGASIANSEYEKGLTPLDGNQWLCERWKRVRVQLKRNNVALYGLRMVEPLRDGTPHWHVMAWFEKPEQVSVLEAAIHRYFRDPDSSWGPAYKGVASTRELSAGAAYYCVKALAKSEQHDMVWASTWGIRRFQVIGAAASVRAEGGAA